MIEEEVDRTPGLPDWVNFITQDISGMTMMWENKPYFHREIRYQRFLFHVVLGQFRATIVPP